MKTIITLDRADQPFGFPQLNANGNFNSVIIESGLTANTLVLTALTQSLTDTDVLSIDNSGVVHTYPISSITGGTSSSGNFLPLSGGTVSGNTIFQSGLTANTISATTYQNLPIDPDIYVTGFSFNQTSYILSLNQNTSNQFSAFTANLAVLSSDVTITGGTYNQNTGVATFTNNSGGSFNVSGFTTGLTDTLVTAFTYNNNTFTVQNSNGTSLDANFNILTGLTINGGLSVTGGTILQNLTATSVSATTYFNLPSSTFTGGTVTGPTNFTSGLSANTISATTYFNLPVTSDTFTTAATFTSSAGTITFARNFSGNYTVTGLTGFTTAFTYSNNTFTIGRNGTTNLTAIISSSTGFTINGNLVVTGTSTTGSLTVTSSSTFNGSILATSLSGTTDRFMEVNSGGTVSATRSIVNAYISTGSTPATLLDNTNNWDINGVYTGTTITGTFQGQNHYNSNYFFVAVNDNLWIRLIRG